MGIKIEEIDLGHEDPEIRGLVLVRRLDDGYIFGAYVRPGQSAEVLALFAEWILIRAPRLVEHGTEPDGWQTRSDGDLQLWARLVEMPGI